MRQPRLGEEEPASAGITRQHYDVWREEIQRLPHAYEEYPEGRIFIDFRRTKDRSFWLIIGEPGAGKSTLLSEWFGRWAGELGAPYLGMGLPILVPLRSLESSDGTRSIAQLADRMIELGVDACARLQNDCTRFYRPESVRAFTPAWLLDGLDELLPSLITETFFQRLVNLPGTKVVTCRTAIYEALRQLISRYQQTEREYDIIGLGSADQLEFLVAAKEGDRQRAENLHEAIQRHTAVRLLAANPLMLALIAEVVSTSNFPKTRAGFYRDAVREMWHRKVGGDADASALIKARDAVLVRIARRMQMETIEGELLWLQQEAQQEVDDRAHNLITLLQRAGLVRVDFRHEVFSFAHLTFQEYYLACSFGTTSLFQLLADLWRHPNYEETLALIISIRAKASGVHPDGAEEIGNAFRRFVNVWQTLHNSTQILWQEQRSPLRTVLHILTRTGIRLDTRQYTGFLAWLWKSVTVSPLRARAVASDPTTPIELLMHLSKHAEIGVRCEVAGNPNTPVVALMYLVQDPDLRVRVHAARNVSTPPKILTKLAYETDCEIRRAIAGNKNTPVEVLMRLAQDPEREVRGSVAVNRHTSAEILTLLAHDHEAYVRSWISFNHDSPAEALMQLAQDPVIGIRMGTSMNPSTPVEALLRLGEDEERMVRGHVAGNPSLPSGTLIRLAQDTDSSVRAAAATNPSTPTDVLMQLANDPNSWVRFHTAKNPNTPVEALLQLVEDADSWVRWYAARNPSTPNEGRIRMTQEANTSPVGIWLAHSDDPTARAIAASHQDMPAEELIRLSYDTDHTVRGSTAENPSTPAEALLRLARDLDTDVRIAAIRNTALLLEDLV
jgi:hypothetical protein